MRRSRRASAGGSAGRSRPGWRDRAPAPCRRGASRPGSGSAGSRFPRGGRRAAGRSARARAGRRTPAGPGSRCPGRRRPRTPCWAGPASCEPVCTNVIAGSWLIASVCIERMMQMSSTISAVCGKSSLSQAPLWPCRANLKIDGATGKLFCPEVIVVIRWPIRTESGSSIPRRLSDRRLVVEEVHLRRGAGLEQVDHPLGLGREMRQARRDRHWRRARPRRFVAAAASARPCRPSQQRAQGHRAQADARAFRKSRRLSCWTSLQFVHGSDVVTLIPA